ncbi:MAG: crossover junction endodeoxyribonuclease RuvC [Acidobacteriota bacterium]|nr:crossover junction endodeoxyribonuclease RuvC [Acidobacteriota bacterium]
MSLIQNLPVILAVDPGTRELGFAVLEGESLVYYGVKTVTNRKAPSLVLETISAFIKTLIEKYQPSYLAIEKMFITQKNSALLYVAAEQIKAVAKEAGISIWEQSPLVIRKRLCKTGRATKREAAKIIADRYPELVRYYNRTRYWELEYYANLFDAITVGLVCLEDLIQMKVTGERAQ